MGEANDPAGVLCQLSNPRTRLRYQRPSIAFCHHSVIIYFIKINSCFHLLQVFYVHLFSLLGFSRFLRRIFPVLNGFGAAAAAPLPSIVIVYDIFLPDISLAISCTTAASVSSVGAVFVAALEPVPSSM